jgi:hypothetical protein
LHLPFAFASPVIAFALEAHSGQRSAFSKGKCQVFAIAIAIAIAER